MLIVAYVSQIRADDVEGLESENESIRTCSTIDFNRINIDQPEYLY